MKSFLLPSFCILSLLWSFQARAGVGEYAERLAGKVSQTWKSRDYNVFVPVWTWHNRLTYDKDKIEEYNEEPWGIGVGKSRYDQNGNWHSLYAMGFKDSNKHLQTIFGYAFQKNWFLDDKGDFAVGAGYTLSLTQRSEYLYIPLPLPLPLVGMSYKDFAVQAAYVPGFKNTGNVLFTWLRFPLSF